jgi:hypothetical protein
MNAIYIYYGVLHVSGTASCSDPSHFKKRKYNPLCDTDDEAICDAVNGELDIDSDDEMDLEIEGETVSEESSNEKSESESESETRTKIQCVWC